MSRNEDILDNYSTKEGRAQGGSPQAASADKLGTAYEWMTLLGASRGFYTLLQLPFAW